MSFRKKLVNSRLLNPFKTNLFANCALNQDVDSLKPYHIILRRFFAYPLIKPMLPLKISKKVSVYKESFKNKKISSGYVKGRPHFNPFKSYVFVANHYFPEEIAANLVAIGKHVYTLIGTTDQVKNNGDMTILWAYGFLNVDKLEVEKKGSRHDSFLRMMKVIRYGGSVILYPTGVLNNSMNVLCEEPFSGFYNLTKESKQWYCSLIDNLFDKFERGSSQSVEKWYHMFFNSLFKVIKWLRNWAVENGTVEVVPIVAHTSNNSNDISIIFGKPENITEMSREEAFSWFRDKMSGLEFEMMKLEHDKIKADPVDLEAYNNVLEECQFLSQVSNLEFQTLLLPIGLETILSKKDAVNEQSTLYSELCDAQIWAAGKKRELFDSVLNTPNKKTIGGILGNNQKNVVISLPFDDPDTGKRIHENVVSRASLGGDPKYEILRETCDKYYDNTNWTRGDPAIWDVELSGHAPRIPGGHYLPEEEVHRRYGDIGGNQHEGKYYHNWWEAPEYWEGIEDKMPDFDTFFDGEDDPWAFYDRLNYRDMSVTNAVFLAPEVAKRRVLRRERDSRDTLKKLLLERGDK